MNYHPNKSTALCLCIGAKLNLDESKDLLSRAFAKMQILLLAKNEKMWIMANRKDIIST